jgi:hypothetical protein
MPHRFGTPNWSLTVAAGWNAYHELECATLVHDPSGGALQISAAFKDSDVTDEDLLDFAAEHIESGRKGVQVQLGDFRGWAFTYVMTGAFWRCWYLRRESQALFVTYNCPVEERGAEDSDVDQMLGSLSRLAVG